MTERLDANDSVPIYVRHEHLARYQFASGFVSGKTVVDCACGDGTGSVIYLKAGATNVYAVDISTESIQKASHGDENARLQFLVGNATLLPLFEKSADLFISLETIEHIDKDVHFLTEVKRILKPDGLFICSTPNRIICNPAKPLTAKPLNPFHVREYDDQELQKLLSRFFLKIDWYGQNPRTSSSVKRMEQLARTLPFNLTVRIQQLLKIPMLFHDKISHHQVIAAKNRSIFEYQIAVCSQPS